MSHDAQTQAIVAAAIKGAAVRLTAQFDPDELAALIAHLQREVLHVAIRTCAAILAGHFAGSEALAVVPGVVAHLQRERVGLSHSEDDDLEDDLPCTWENTSVEVAFAGAARDGSECRESAWLLSGSHRTQDLLDYLEERGPLPGPLFVDADGKRITPALVRELMQEQRK
jgi:hypothetical protein